MSTQHNYTNPAFCQQSEYYSSAPTTPAAAKTAGMAGGGSLVSISAAATMTAASCTRRNEQLTRSYHRISSKVVNRQHSLASFDRRTAGGPQVAPPIPGKPLVNARLLDRYGPVGGSTGSAQPQPIASLDNAGSASGSRYALVPVEEIPFNVVRKYSVVDERQLSLGGGGCVGASRSDEFLDRVGSVPNLGGNGRQRFQHDRTLEQDQQEDDGEEAEEEEMHNLSDQFRSLPPMMSSHSTALDQHSGSRLKNAFSSDFGSKSFILYDQRNNQRFEMVPTEEDEELVDENQEIIQMHNGRAHRYAIIPSVADDEDETCLSNGNSGYSATGAEDPTAIHRSPARTPSARLNHQQQRGGSRRETPKPQLPPTPSQQQQSLALTPSKATHPGQGETTPKKNPATLKLHELLTTPQKKNTPQWRSQPPPPPSPFTLTPSTTPQRRAPAPPMMVSSTPKQPQHQLQQLQPIQQSVQSPPTTAIISPRLNSDIYSEKPLPLDPDKSVWGQGAPIGHKSWQKMANASATIGAVSLMLILCGFMNSGLSLYMTAKLGREFYLDMGILAGFSAIALGILGFKSRQCDWLPNRNYMSGYVLVTIFSLLNCCAEVILMTMHPYPGTPLNDVTTGIILGLSSLIILLISLGAITSRWCRAPPPDNRVDVCTTGP
ncbi:uncharacterized protein LOC131289230 [Anopheles ziemanni]|uniref:uncharacterized protein LOC131271980 n=1 Tax=Anopheles coustani TaxID=139045 RepID=UPI00265B644A|nr:uncharacterized protein LOC131271980 [Anopheles coustani]XP_058174425.1 uncharacterized protein LOC131289230 [Anopheles ziemanni]